MYIDKNQDGDDFLFIIYKSNNSNIEIGQALIKKKQNSKGDFWHLDNLYIEKEYRNQSYGSKLLEHIVDNFKQSGFLGIRVHPANGQKGFEDLLDYISKNNHNQDHDLKTEYEKLKNNPEIFEETLEISVNSDELREWYKQRGFNKVDDDEPKYLWHIF